MSMSMLINPQNGIQNGSSQLSLLMATVKYPYVTCLREIHLKFGGLSIRASTVKNLINDASMNMSSQISPICKSVNFYIRNLWRLKKFITREACHHAVRTLVLSCISIMSTLFFFFFFKLLHSCSIPLQRVGRVRRAGRVNCSFI